MAGVRAVLFDYGHTLVDFHLAEEKLLVCYTEVRRMLEGRAYRELPRAPDLVRDVSRRVAAQIVESYEGHELQELDIVTLFDDALRVAGLTLPKDLVRQIAEMEHRAIVSEISMPPENLAVLRELRHHDLKLGLVSNATLLPEMMREDIERLGIAREIDAAVFSSEAGVRKPHPAIFERVLGQLEVSAEDAIFVGDRLRDDVGGAKRLGMRGVLTRQYRQEDVDGLGVRPDLVIHRLEEIIPYVLAHV